MAGIKIGECHMMSLILPIYDISTIIDNQFRIYHPTNGIGCFELVNINDPTASPLRIYTNTGVKAISAVVTAPTSKFNVLGNWTYGSIIYGEF